MEIEGNESHAWLVRAQMLRGLSNCVRCLNMAATFRAYLFLSFASIEIPIAADRDRRQRGLRVVHLIRASRLLSHLSLPFATSYGFHTVTGFSLNSFVKLPSGAELVLSYRPLASSSTKFPTHLYHPSWACLSVSCGW